MRARISNCKDRTGIERDKLVVRVIAETKEEQSHLWKVWEEAGLDNETARGFEVKIGSSPREGKIKTLKLLIEHP